MHSIRYIRSVIYDQSAGYEIGLVRNLAKLLQHVLCGGVRNRRDLQGLPLACAVTIVETMASKSELGKGKLLSHELTSDMLTS